LQAVTKAKTAADQKMVSLSAGSRDRADLQITDEIKQYFDANPNENVFVGVFGIGGNAKVSSPSPIMNERMANPQILSAASAIGKTLSKAVYVFSPDEETGKVAHLNYLPKEVLSSKKLDAKIWLGEVSKVIGGKVRLPFRISEKLQVADYQGGGRDDSATGVGSEGDKIKQAVAEALRVYKEKVEA
jgi:alanyl-tRNA synthetase